jgi:hypothetical protein
MEPGKKRAVAFMRIVRDRCFEGLLMLRVAQKLPDDPRIQEWAAEHADPEPEDGLSAVLPDACIDAVSAFVGEAGNSEDEDELIEEALDGAYEIIGLILRFSDDDAMDSLAHCPPPCTRIGRNRQLGRRSLSWCGQRAQRSSSDADRRFDALPWGAQNSP